MRRKSKPTTDAVEIIHRRYFAGHPKRIAELEAVRAEGTSPRKKTSKKKA